MSRSDHVMYANAVLSSGRRPDAAEAFAHARELRGQDDGLARRLLTAIGNAIDDPILLVRVKQSLAIATFKDEDLPAPQRYEEALSILKTYCDLESTTDAETLGIAGSIYKRMRDASGRREDLERALDSFERGRELDADDDEGWASLNAAFMLDLLAQQELSSGGTRAQQSASERRAKADSIRSNVLANLERQQGDRTGHWWFWVSLAEAALGLGDIAKAEAALWHGLEISPPTLAIQTTARHFATLIHVRIETTPRFADAAAMFTRIFGISDVARQGLVIGKIGLALSGGGFRAALFHIGVLANLAELDILRHVEVISCVSGGSIVGMSYYLELKKRLERGPLSRNDYIQIVRDLERKFLAGVQTNIRTSVASNPFKSLLMALKTGYTRSDRLAELYQKRLYDAVPDEGEAPARMMSDLLVALPGRPDFHPQYDNWQLDAKVPMLVLNATSLNTGHNWQFTASWMGESPQSINPDVDVLPRFRRCYYHDVHDTMPIPIGLAVAASACVPGLFEPITLSYSGATVRLVDGGVHDNQGLAALLDASCRVILVSDASGQMTADLDPACAVAAAVSRANAILQARVRESRYDRLSTLRRAGAIQGSMFVHLTQELGEDPISSSHDVPQVAPAPSPPMTTYGVDREIQKLLSRVRTDLDSFSDAEAFALMTSGYLMTQQALLEHRSAPMLPILDQQVASSFLRPVSWSFLSARDALTKADQRANQRMKNLLRDSHRLAFKIWHQSLALMILAYALMAGLAARMIWTFVQYADEPILGVEAIPVPINAWAFVALLAVAAGLVIRGAMHEWLGFRKRVGELLLGIGLALAAPVVWIHLFVFDKLFLRHGRWPRAPETPGNAGPPVGPRLPIKAEAPPAAASAVTPGRPSSGQPTAAN